MTYTSENFFEATIADFTRCERPDREPDYESYSGSRYWYTSDGVIRESDHWGKGIASCSWMLDGGYYGYGMHPVRIYREGGKARVVYLDGYDKSNPELDNVCGFCKWENFEANAA